VPLPLDPPGPRSRQDADGLGDVTLTPRFWVLDPARHPGGNLQVGLGVKIPTGREDAEDVYPDLFGANPRRKPVDVSIQPGDGGWGALLDLAAFRDVGPVRLFASGTYLANPRDTNRTPSIAASLLGPAAVPARIRVNSVPDQFLLQGGVAVPLGRGFSASLAVRWEGVPPRDLVGGEDGFRRPGYTVAFAPGLSWTTGRTTFSVSVPRTHVRNRLNDASGAGGDATFSEYSILAGVTIRF
jgi:hypothetical protein